MPRGAAQRLASLAAQALHATGRAARGIALTCPLLLSLGCQTILAQQEGYPEQPIYGGTARNLEGLGDVLSGDEEGLTLWFYLVDLPLTLVADTIILPFTIYQQLHSEAAASAE